MSVAVDRQYDPLQPDRVSAQVLLDQTVVPLPIVLRMLAGGTSSARDRRWFWKLADSLEQGGDLTSAISSAPDHPIARRFRRLLPVPSGLRPERLLGVLIDLRQTAQRTNRKVFEALLYPTALVSIAMLMMVLVFGTFVPQFHQTQEMFGVSPSGMTSAAYVLFNWLSTPTLAEWLLLLIPVALLLAMAWGLWHLPLTKRLIRLLPIIGSLLNDRSRSEALLLLAEYVDAGSPLAPAIRSVGAASDDFVLSAALHQLAQLLEEGRTLAQAASAVPELPQPLYVVLAGPVEGLSLADCLRLAAESTLAGSDARLHPTLGVLEPIGVVTAGIGIVFWLWVMLFPMVNLLNALS